MTMDINSTVTIGIYDVSVNIDRWTMTYNFDNETYNDAFQENVGVYSANSLNLGFTSEELGALHPSFGYRVEDASTIGSTAMNYDYPGKQVPEPSSAVLCLLASGLLVIRRRS